MSTPKIRPIMFSPAMVRALLADQKSNTRRLASSPLAKSEPGDLLWVRERAAVEIVESMPEIGIRYEADKAFRMVPFPADRMRQVPVPGKCLNMGCYREASRLTLAVTGKIFQRLQDISDGDAIREGATCRFLNNGNIGWSMDWSPIGQTDKRGRVIAKEDIALATPRAAFACYINELHGGKNWNSKPNLWDKNPPMVALSFEVFARNVDLI